METSAFGGPPALAGSDPLPQIVLIGGDGGTSGVPRHMLHLADGFQDLAKVTLISDLNEGGFDDVEKFCAQHIVLPGLQTRKSLRHLWGGLRGLTRYLRRSKADLVWLHARMPVLMGRLVLALRLWRPKRRVAVTFHGLPFGPGHRPLNARLSKALEKTLLSLCPPLDLIFLSQPMADQMTAAMGERRMAKHRVHVLPNCSDLGPLPAAQPSTVMRLVMTGRVGWQKNYPLAAQILAHLPENYSLTLCGAGTDSADFQQEISASVPPEVASRIHYAGPLRDVRDALMSADGYMLCSRYEGLPIGALEAFEAGMPVILSRFAGAEDLATTSAYSRVLNFDDLPTDALEIDQLMTRYKADHNDPRAAIRANWEATWSPEIFRKRSQIVLGKLLA